MDYFDRRDSVFMHEGEIYNYRVCDIGDSEIQKFYENKNVLITGATGVVGSHLVERLLRTFPKLGRIYLLVRPKNNTSVNERIFILLNSKTFHNVSKIQKEFKNKIQTICGDLALPSCGLTEYDQKQLLDNIHVVFHCATADISQESLKNTLYTNVLGTKHLLELATKIAQLKAFIFVSDAYLTDFHQNINNEKIHKSLFSENGLKYFEANLNNQQITVFIPKIVGQELKCYSFKAFAEEIVAAYMDKINLAIARSSNVVSDSEDELVDHPSITDRTTGAMTESLKSIKFWRFRTINVDIPVNQVINTLIAISWQIGTHMTNGKKLKIPIYNVISSNREKNTDREFKLENHNWAFFSKNFFHQLIFGITFDLYMWMERILSKTRLFKLFTKDGKTYEDLKLKQSNMAILWSQMSTLDKKVFNLHVPNHLNWQKLKSRFMKGVLLNYWDEVEITRMRYYRNLIVDCVITIIKYCLYLLLLQEPFRFALNIVNIFLF